MNASEKPALVPSLATAGTLVGIVLLLLAFVAAVALYSAADRCLAAAKDLKRSRPTRVETRHLAFAVPSTWARYSVEADDVYMYRSPADDLPLMFCTAQCDASYAYRALDTNPSLVLRQLRPTLCLLYTSPSPRDS